jgi:reductive dehalogenase
LRDSTYKRFITGPLSRFDDRNSGFSRLLRDEVPNPDERTDGQKTFNSPVDKLYNQRPAKLGRKGYEQKDQALVWAGRTIDRLVRKSSYARDIEAANTDVDVSDRAAITRQVKSAARWLGADLVGICEVDPNWVYSQWGDYNAFFSGGLANAGDAIEIPSWLKYAVVMAVEMDYEQIRRSPALEPATALGYAKMAFVAPSLATYISQLGYRAMPSGNDFALNIPLAIDAGLGELGRNGLLVTEQFGPRVRICKVFTDLPLEVDPPVDIGVQAFCERCKLCSQLCPGRALVSGERTDKAWDVSNNVNVLKWPVKAMDCLTWWRRNGGSCGVCIRVCPYNKPKGWLHSCVRRIVKTTPVFDTLFVEMDRALGYGKQVVN